MAAGHPSLASVPSAGVNKFWFTITSWGDGVPGGERYFTLNDDMNKDAKELELLDGCNIVVPQSPSNGGGNPHD